MHWLVSTLIGLIAGIFGGIFGIGGATILIPALIYIAHLTQHQAQGIALAALLPPVGFLAFLRYYQSGNVKLSLAGFICFGFFIGGLIGASLAQGISEPMLKRMFGFYLFFISVRMILTK